jgi:hypothetical protein
VDSGAQEFGKGISRLQGILENANMLCHDMQPIALLIWQNFITAKKWALQTYTPQRNLSLKIQESLRNNSG